RSVSTQSGTKLPFRGSPAGNVFVSFQVRVTFRTIPVLGPTSRAWLKPSPARYLPHATLIAVFPLPNTSYATPTRGVTSLKFGRSFTLGTERAAMNAPAGISTAGV